jgi:APA family basic amino acid/polyamine antiporter
VIASLSALLSLIVGISRTLFAMASNGEMPRALAAVHPRYRVPHRAELAVGAVVAVIVALADVRGAIGFSSFAVLVYYAIANVSAWRQQRRWQAIVGLLGCLVLAGSLPLVSIGGGAALFTVGALVYWLTSRASRARASS